MNDSDAKALRARIADETDDDLVELDPRWEQYAAGTLPADEVDALLQQRTSSALDEALAEAMAPLDASVKGRITEFAGTHFRKTPPPRVATWRAWWLGVVAVVAGAAAILLSTPSAGPQAPDYEAIWRSGEQAVRSEGPAPEDHPTFVAGSRLQLDLRPVTEPEQEPAVVVAVDSWEHRIEGVVSFTPFGVLRVQGEVGRAPFDLPAGAHTLLVALGPPSASVDPGAPPPADWQHFSRTFQVSP